MATEPTVSRPSDLVTIIDPNPVGHVIEHEDLYIYASLVAKTKGRTFLTEKADGSIDADSLDVTTVDLIVSDTGARKEDKRKYLSTNWTTIGGSQIAGTDVVNNGDLEGFGITNVEIKMEGSYIPTVVIDFVDIRGATLFEQGSCSPYGLFFHLPYPIFELTVKGYYGKPATYYLNLVKFNTKFNAETGNFECRGEFIGWSYAFLADILMGYVRCSNYMKKQWGARKSLQQKYDEAIEYYWDNGLYDSSDYISVGNIEAVYLESDDTIIQPFCRQTEGGLVECYTITDLIWKIKDIKYFLGQVKTDDQYVEVGNLVTLRNLILDMRSELKRLTRLLDENHSGSILEKKPSLEPTSVGDNKYVFNGTPDVNLKNRLLEFLARPIDEDNSFTGQITAVIPRVKNWKITKDNTIPARCGGSFVTMGSNLNVNNGLTGCRDLLEDPLKFQWFDGLDGEKFQKGMLTSTIDDKLNYVDVDSDGDDYYIDFGFIDEIINEALGKIDSELEGRRNKIKEEIDNEIVKILGFRPTIRNVFTILSCNVENFVQLLLNCSLSAEEHHKKNQQELFDKFTNATNDRLLELKNASPGQSLEEQPPIFSWPTYYQEKYSSLSSYSDNKKETKEVFPGENPDFYDWPEVRFVEDFIQACEKLNKDDEALQEDKSGIPGFDNYTPINPLESKLYGEIACKYRNAATLLEDNRSDEATLKIMAERMFVTLDFSFYDPIRLNVANIGLGHTIPYRNIKPNSDGTFGGPAFSEWNKDRLWMHPQYSNDGEIVKQLAKIDAHNLLSCVDDPSVLSNIDLTVFQGDLDAIKVRMKSVLYDLTQDRTSADKTDDFYLAPVGGIVNEDYRRIYNGGPWFNPNTSASDLMAFEGNSLIGATSGDFRSLWDSDYPNSILNDIDGWDNTDNYWSYYPNEGKILFVGEDTPGGLGRSVNIDTALFVHSDIKKMKQEHLFQLYTEDEYKSQLEGRTNIKYDEGTTRKDEIKERREELNKGLSEELRDRLTKQTSAMSYLATEDVYKIEGDSLLQTFDGGQKATKSVFIGLDSKYTQYDKTNAGTAGSFAPNEGFSCKDYGYDIRYWGVPVYITHAYERISGGYLAGYNWDTLNNGTGSMQFPFAQGVFLGYGNDSDAPGKVALAGKPQVGSILSSSVPEDYALELPGKGIYKDVAITYYDANSTVFGTDPIAPFSLKKDAKYWYDQLSTTTPIEFDPVDEWDKTNAVWAAQVDTEASFTWSGAWTFTHLIQTPLWLDNINKWRKYTSKSTPKTRNESNYQWYGTPDFLGNTTQNRPLESNNYELQSPTIKAVKSTYTDNGITLDLESFGFNEPNDEVDAYTAEQIQNRNLAYLFLAGLKTSPFITCGGRVSNNTTELTDLVNLDFIKDNGIYNYVEDHYPKSILPFVKSSGLVKLPKAWVYGMGSVMWRFKMYMGAHVSKDGDILTWYWKSPSLQRPDITTTTDVPTGKDPLAQPGHPSYGPYIGTSKGGSFFGEGMVGGAGRKWRSWSMHNTSQVSTPNGQSFGYPRKTLTSSIYNNTVSNDQQQLSSFGPSTTVDGWRRSLTAGYDDPTKELEWEMSRGTLNGLDTVQSMFNDNHDLRLAWGCFFDYWGVYSHDPAIKDIPGSTYFTPFINTVDGVGPTNSYYTRWLKFNKYERSQVDSWYDEWLDEFDNDYNPGELSFQSAREASMNSYWPLLWITPWQHFYTEPINYDGEAGPRNPTPNGDANNVAENRLTFIPSDHIFRDYVGNFGKLGNETSNYANYKLGNPSDDERTMSISPLWWNPAKVNEPTRIPKFKEGSFGSAQETFPRLVTNFSNSDKYPMVGNNTDTNFSRYVNIEGGKYADLMAVLPTFVKEKFVQEFENWVDNVFKDKLSLVDPVNFLPNRVSTLKLSSGTNLNVDLLGKSYRSTFFGTSDGSTEKPFGSLIGFYSSDHFEEGVSVTGLDDANPPTTGVPAFHKKAEQWGDIEKFGKSLLDEYYYAVIPTPRLFGLDVTPTNVTPFYANERLIDIYLESFREEWRSENGYEKYFISLSVDGENSNNSILDDGDIKLALYRSFKSINDKWISSTQDTKSGKPKFFFNITDNGLDEEKTPLAGHFSYVNRVMGEIGNKSVLDVIRLEKIKDNPKMSFYNLISDLLGENKFDFFPLPTFTNFTTPGNTADPNKVAKDMFSPFTNKIKKESGPNFICMYVGGTSRTLDLKPKSNCAIDKEDMNYNDDGMSLSQEDFDSGSVSYEFQDPKTPLVSDNRFEKRNEKKRIENNGITAFRVAYGIENQNMFKSVELDQTEFSETNESLMVIDRLATGGNPANRTQKGNNLHNVYLTRSYTCKVSSMGNMMIQPLQYFDLTNIPMFYGTYLITKVEHTIKPHHIDTNFTGVRQPIATVPVVEDIAVALNESFASDEIEPIEGPNVLGGTSVTGSGNPNNSGGGYNTSSTSSVSVAGVNYIDIGATDPTQYYNRRWKWCNSCSTKGDTSKGRWGGPNQGTASNPSYTRWIDETTPMQDFNTSKLEYIILHWTAGFRDTADSNTHWQNGTHYHFEIDKDGTLNKISDTTKVAIHGNNMNSYSIGVSYVGGVENGDLRRGYVRTVDDWNAEDLNLNGRTNFKSKKQFAAIFQAIVLAVQEHPQIKYLTSHHFVSNSKVDVGDKFPYDILISKLREVGIDLELKYSGTAPSGVVWTGDAPVSVSGDIDLSFIQNAQQQELSGNSGAVSTPNPNTYDPNQVVGQGITPPTATSNGGSAVQNALNSAGQI